VFDSEQIDELRKLIREYGLAEWNEGVQAANDQSEDHELSMKLSRMALEAINFQLNEMGLL